MIAANVLQIGDWVMEGGTPSQVTVIFCDGQLETTKSECTGIELIEPVPLTPEILEKNGFKNMGFFGKCEVENWKILCDTKNVAIIHKEHTDIDIPIEYVHELQHALRLCGIDKEIVL